MYLSDLRVYFKVEVDYANMTNIKFIVDPTILFVGWLIFSYLQIFKLIKCKWLPGECADWFFDNIMTSGL